MADLGVNARDFERGLERLFGEVAEYPDCEAFAEGVGRRLNRGWTARRWLIGAAGVLGGLIGVNQLVVTNFTGRVEAAEDSVRLLQSGIAQVAPTAEWLSTLPGGGNTVWMAAALAVLMLAFVLSRVIEEI